MQKYSDRQIFMQIDRQIYLYKQAGKHADGQMNNSATRHID